ncbi:MAG: serine hydrolase, partial [Planctomycetes bacterium]|nr:serine hydrolase [Planctomycetota bacterium]
HIFKPLKMKHTTYNPPKKWLNDIAATQIFDDNLLRGFVHDPLAQLNAGISGNAGLFTNAHDLSIYCRMVLNGGTYQGVRILSPEAVQFLTRSQSKNRSFGFGVTTSYSWIKDEDTVEKSFSHLGYTGTAMVGDPINHIYLIILTNRVHPHDTGNINPFRTQLAEIIS